MKTRFWVYGAILLLLIFAAVWVFRPGESYKELKKQTAVAADPDAERVVRDFLAAAENRDKSRLGALMLIRDSTDLERYADPFFGKKTGPVKFLAFRRLDHSSKINLTAVVYSQPLDRSFAFTLVKDGKKRYRVYSVGGSGQRP